ncbi:hypothetical protein [Methylobacterium nonmethylotrophicum]|uniref:Uncharacterized protein n=1 Tax=Methylobacterium nonmethylotrophicum TaxID=1141884 RepID=A0A4Z0NDT9_9HYPH|nr:hypothetical protein [Methylobacterium nonmethylotrophicum]TGD91506.1 hypothetical protein EU555_35780 [Methylobacterium nonmethylotrophicum]
MPTDLPSQRQSPRTHGLSTLHVAFAGLRLRFLGWGMAQAVEDRDHVKLLKRLNAWADLHERISKRLDGEISATTGSNRSIFCDRVRESVSKIAHEERRIERVAGRMKQARSQGRRRDYERSYMIAKNSYNRTLFLWNHISLSFHSGK